MTTKAAKRVQRAIRRMGAIIRARHGKPPHAPTGPAHVVALPCRRQPARLATDNRGVVAIEFAVLLVPMLLIVALVVDIGLAVTSKQQMQAATYEAARAGANGGDASATFMAGLSGHIKDTATVSCATSGNLVTCDATGTHTNVMAGLPGVGLLSNIRTHATAFKPPPP